MTYTIGIVIFDGAEELDFVGPWEVFTMARQLHQADSGGAAASEPAVDLRVLLIAQEPKPIICAKGMRVLPDCTIRNAPPLDVVLVPGGRGTRTEVGNRKLMRWLTEAGAASQWVTSVCTGALLLHEAGFARGRRVTTYWDFVETLRQRGDVEVVDDARYMRDGNVVTAAGVSAGIDMALWLTGELWGVEFARRVQQATEYYPEPPYAGDAPA